jgi:hypothetical protein
LARRIRPTVARPVVTEEVYEPVPERPRRSWVVRLGTLVVMGAVVVSSLLPLLEMFNRGPGPVAPDPTLQAIATAEDAVVTDPTDPVRWESLASALERAGKTQEAALARAEAGRRRSSKARGGHSASSKP